MQECHNTIAITSIRGKRLKIPAAFIKDLSIKPWCPVSIKDTDCYGFVLDVTGDDTNMLGTSLLIIPKELRILLDNKKRTRYYVYKECPQCLHIRKVTPCCPLCGNPKDLRIIDNKTVICGKCEQEMET